MSVKKLLLHIGTPKTATTTIQKTLNDYAKENLIEGFIYPDFGSVNHHDLMVLFKSYDRIPRSLKGKYPNLKSYEEGRLNLKKSFNNLFLNSNNVLLSTEYFFTMNQEEINNLKNELSYVKDLEIMICIYVRDPLSYYVSYVQQYCKASKNIPNPIKFRYNFKSIILKWEEYFPNIMVKPFSKEKFLNGCIVQDFMQVVNAFFDIKCELSLNTKASNESLSLEALYILIFYRRYFYSDEDNVFYPDSNRLINLMLNLTKNLKMYFQSIDNRTIVFLVEEQKFTNKEGSYYSLVELSDYEIKEDKIN
jgi:hypothetical protein